MLVGFTPTHEYVGMNERFLPTESFLCQLRRDLTRSYGDAGSPSIAWVLDQIGRTLIQWGATDGCVSCAILRCLAELRVHLGGFLDIEERPALPWGAEAEPCTVAVYELAEHLRLDLDCPHLSELHGADGFLVENLRRLREVTQVSDRVYFGTWVTVREAARFHRTSEANIRYLLRSGRIDGQQIHIGGRPYWLCSAQSVRKYSTRDWLSQYPPRYQGASA